jgi:RNA polymerase sigma factor (sigma-70 family)
VGSGLMVLEAPAAAIRQPGAEATDSELVAAVRRGEDRAFEALYARYQRRIAAYVFGMVKDHGRAEDVTQEVFMSALRRMRETDRPIAFKPWVYEIAKNACIDQFRRSRRAEEVSFDAGDALGSADHGRLVASQPSPDMAMHTKQQLDHLCGAFGGLSETHHEILVLRELEGLSYREIGERMGLSRPGVESTLFRARRRLTEEYDELVSGKRCVRIQGIIAGAAASLPGARDSRRLARHVAHCQPCRRQAVLAGLDTAAMDRRPARRRVADKIAALFPFPAFLRMRGLGGGQLAVPLSEPMAAAWSKAVAAAATLIIAGAGVGVGAGVGTGAADPDRPAPAPHRPAVKAAPASAPRQGPAAGSEQRERGSRASAGRVQPRSSRTGGPARRDEAPRSRTPTSAGTGSPAGSSDPASSSPDRGAPPPSEPEETTQGSKLPAAGSSPVEEVEVPDSGVHVPLPDPSGTSPTQTGDTIQAVQETVAPVVDTVEDVVSDAEGALPPLGG